MPASLAAQVRLSRLLGYGFACSLVSLGGVGSLAATLIGFRARRIIKQSEHELSGIILAWWCIIAGGLQAAFLLPYLVWQCADALSSG